MRRTFSKEFKEEAVNMVLDQGVNLAQAAKDLGIGQSTLNKWVIARRQSQEPGALTEDERAELKRLRKENKIIRMEREILKKATAYFAKTTTPDVSGS